MGKEIKGKKVKSKETSMSKGSKKVYSGPEKNKEEEDILKPTPKSMRMRMRICQQWRTPTRSMPPQIIEVDDVKDEELEPEPEDEEEKQIALKYIPLILKKVITIKLKWLTNHNLKIEL